MCSARYLSYEIHSWLSWPCLQILNLAVKACQGLSSLEVDKDEVDKDEVYKLQKSVIFLEINLLCCRCSYY